MANKKRKPNRTYSQGLAFSDALIKAIVSAGLLGFVSIVDYFILPFFRQDSEILVHLVSTFIAISVGYVIWKIEPVSKKVTITAISFIILGLVFAFRSVLAERRTVYFIVDASPSAASSLHEIAPVLWFNSQVIPNGTEAGLIITGSGLQGKKDCNDFFEFRPAPIEQRRQDVEEISKQLITIQPSGIGNIQGAIMYALQQLSSTEGPNQIIVIAAQFDITCAYPDRSMIDEFITAHQMDVEVLPVAVGRMEVHDFERLNSLADRISSIENPEEIPRIVSEILNSPTFPYGEYYGDAYK